MSRDYELDVMTTRERAAFQRKQIAFQRYIEARDRVSVAYDIMRAAWEKRVLAREKMSLVYEAKKAAGDYSREAWDEYNRVYDVNNARIESLRREANLEYQMMQDCFERASIAYGRGDKTRSLDYATEGHKHKDRRNDLNDKINMLVREIRDAKTNAERCACRVDNSAFYRAKDMFNDAKAHHEAARAEFKRLKNERDLRKVEFNDARTEYRRLKDDFRRKLMEA